MGLKLPPDYDTPEVRDALEEWVPYYKGEFKKRNWSQVSATKTFNRLRKEGATPEDVVEAIDHSLEMGYRGIFQRARVTKRTKVEELPWVPDTRKGYDTPWVVKED